MPSSDHPDDLARVPAVALFVERAHRARPELEADDDALAVIATLVRRLDGLPLAIELAAGRLSSLSLTDLSQRLDRALDVLAGAPTGDQRHATLRAAIGWSYDLLPHNEQRLFRALAVYPGGFDLSTAEQVAREVATDTDPTIAVTHLVDASMLAATFDDTTRYRMLETVRAFGLDRLAAADELETARQRFLVWATRLGNWIDTTIVTENEPAAVACLLTELDNLRAAWTMARTADDIDVAAELVTSLWWAAAQRELTEMTNWSIELASDPRLVDHRAAASVMATAAHALSFIGRLEEGEQLAERAMALVTDHDDPAARRCAFARAGLDLFRGKLDRARREYATAAHGDYWRSVATDLAALCAAYSGDLHEAHRLNASTVGIAAAPSARAHHHYVAAEIDALAGSWETAEQHYRRAIELALASNAGFIHGVASVGLVALYTTHGQLHQALHGYAELIDHWERTGAWTQQWTTLRNAADLFDRLGDRQLGSILRHAADHAPQTPNVAGQSIGDTATTPPSPDPHAYPLPDADGAAYTREEVLKLTRHAITHWLAATPT